MSTSNKINIDKRIEKLIEQVFKDITCDLYIDNGPTNQWFRLYLFKPGSKEDVYLEVDIFEDVISFQRSGDGSLHIHKMKNDFKSNTELLIWMYTNGMFLKENQPKKDIYISINNKLCKKVGNNTDGSLSIYKILQHYDEDNLIVESSGLLQDSTIFRISSSRIMTPMRGMLKCAQ